jgi:hypothetical protein
VENYNLRCQSITDLPAATIFAAPTASDPAPASSFADFLNRTRRVEIIWFPFSDNPWLHVWQVAPDKPAASIAVQSLYNYPFADFVPDGLQHLISALTHGDPASTPLVGQMAAMVTANGLDGKNWAGLAGEYPVSRDIWGPSKNTLLYSQDTTLRVTANGYAVHLRRADVQQAVHDMTTQFTTMLASYAGRGSYPVNSALEIRVTALDDPADVGVADAGSPVISALSMAGVDRLNGWDVAVWFDVLTIPGTEGSNEFDREIQQWIVSRFSGAAGRSCPSGRRVGRTPTRTDPGTTRRSWPPRVPPSRTAEIRATVGTTRWPRCRSTTRRVCSRAHSCSGCASPVRATVRRTRTDEPATDARNDDMDLLRHPRGSRVTPTVTD